MATILPGSPPVYSRNDIEGTVKNLCTYARSMHDNVDYLLGQLQKSVSDLESTAAGTAAAVSALQDSIESLSERVAALENND